MGAGLSPDGAGRHAKNTKEQGTATLQQFQKPAFQSCGPMILGR